MKNKLPKIPNLHWQPRRKTSIGFGGKEIRSYIMDRDVVINHQTGMRAPFHKVIDGHIDLVRL